MLKVDDRQNITLTRGDTLTLTVTLKKGDQTYDPEDGDVIRFACSSGYKGDLLYELKFQAEVPNDTLTFSVGPTVTGVLDYGAYNYDVEITHGDGSVDTVLSARLIITGEVE